MPDITTIRGDTRVVATPVFDADLDRFRTDVELGSADPIEYVVTDSPEAETTYIEKDLTDDELFVTTPDTIDSVEFDDLDADTGIIRVKLLPTDTQPLPADSLWHEFQVTDSDGNETTVMQGAFEVQQSATNPQS